MFRLAVYNRAVFESVNMKISKLLELSLSEKNQTTLIHNFGDAYLLKHNAIFRTIREHSIQSGFSFSSTYNENYSSLSLSQLDQILIKKIIPFYNNISVLTEIEQKIPQTTVWDEVCDNLKKNYLFHESCHAVARSCAEIFIDKKTSTNGQILKILIEESFANSCELLANKDVNDSAHRIFFETNSYIVVYESRDLINKLIKELGFEFIFKFVLLSYLHSNFLCKQIDDKAWTRVLNFISLNSNNLTTDELPAELVKKNYKTLKALSRISFDLNPRFRLVTSHFYLRLMGFKNSNRLNYDFMDVIESDLSFQKLISDLYRKLL